MFWQLLAFNGNLNRYYTFRERERNSKKTADFFSAWTYSNFLQPLSPWINYTFPHLLVGFEVFFPKNGWNLWEHMRTHQQCYLCCFRFQLDDLNLMKSHSPCSLVNSYRMYFSSQPWTKPEVCIMIRWITDPQLDGKKSNESVPEISEDDFIISEADFGQTCN